MKRKTTQYNEILELFEYCKSIGIDATIERLFDGYIIRLSRYGDFIQHQFSYGCQNGCVEPAIGSKLDYTAVPLEKAKELAREFKEKQNGRAKNERKA